MRDAADQPRGRPVLEAASVSAGMVLFALFVRRGLPLVVLSGMGLVMTAIVIGGGLRAARRPAVVLGFASPSLKVGVFVAAGCAVGCGFGVLHRVTWEMGVLPPHLAPFAVVAACIGAAEELVYRGYVQGRLRALGSVVAVALAAAAHTAYKTALFALPPDGVGIDLRYLAVWTFIGGVVFGVLRRVSGSVLPPLAAHVVFDAVVYGGAAQAPWWVWA